MSLNFTQQEFLRIAKQPGYGVDLTTSLLTSTEIDALGRQESRRATKRPVWAKYTDVLRCRFPGPSCEFRWASENQFNQAVADWRKASLIEHPELALLYHLPNENSHRKSGVVGGLPDWHLPVRRGAYSGFWVELKVRDGEPSAAQVEMIRRLEHYGNYAVVVWDDLDAVIEETEGYLRGKV